MIIIYFVIKQFSLGVNKCEAHVVFDLQCKKWLKWSYRPHPKDGEGTVFTGVCLLTGGGVLHLLVPGSFLSSGPMPFPEGYASLWFQVPTPQTGPSSWDWGTPWLGLGYSLQLGLGYPIGQVTLRSHRRTFLL